MVAQRLRKLLATLWSRNSAEAPDLNDLATRAARRAADVTADLPVDYARWIESVADQAGLCDLLGDAVSLLELGDSRGLVLGCRYGFSAWALAELGAEHVVGIVANASHLEVAAYERGYHRLAKVDYALQGDGGALDGATFDWLLVDRRSASGLEFETAMQQCVQRVSSEGVVVVIGGVELDTRAFGLGRTTKSGDARAYRVERVAEPTSRPVNALFPHRPLDSDIFGDAYVDRRVNGPMRSYSDARKASGRVLPLAAYRDLLGVLAAAGSGFRFVPLCEFESVECGEDVVIGVRHDVDHDVVNCLPMSEVEQSLGVVSTYFLLHNSDSYYGMYLAGGRFLRFASMLESYRRIQANGQEIGLHIDPIGVTAALGVDGVAAMLQEIDYLRQQGLAVRGVCGHNSHSVYNADNKDVFAMQNTADTIGELRTESGLRIPLGGVDPQVHGIEYVGDFNQTVGYTDAADPKVSPFGFRIDRDPEYRLAYDVSYSITLGGNWEINGPAAEGPSSVPDAQILERLQAEPPGRKLLFNIHPMYYGFRGA